MYVLETNFNLKKAFYKRNANINLVKYQCQFVRTFVAYLTDIFVLKYWLTKKYKVLIGSEFCYDFNSIWLEALRICCTIYEKIQGLFCEKRPTLFYIISKCVVFLHVNKLFRLKNTTLWHYRESAVQRFMLIALSLYALLSIRAYTILNFMVYSIL